VEVNDSVVKDKARNIDKRVAISVRLMALTAALLFSVAVMTGGGIGSVVFAGTAHPPRWVRIQADGDEKVMRSNASTVGELLHGAGIALRPQDVVLVQQTPLPPDAPLPRLKPTPTPPSPIWRGNGEPAPLLQVSVRRAVTLYLHEGNNVQLLQTTATTVGAALHEAGIVLFPQDEVRPPLSAPTSDGLHIFWRRSVPITIYADQKMIVTRSVQPNVGAALRQAGMAIMGMDEVSPTLNTPLTAGLVIRVRRVRERIELEDEMIPYKTIYVPDDSMLIDTLRVRQPGVVGIKRKRYRVRVVDGIETVRRLEDQWVARQPVNKEIAYGRKIVLHKMDTPSGPITYWRHFRVLATSYSAATSGKKRSHPEYGITYMGWHMRHGIVAVDPRVIKLGSRLYVPGYGIGDVGDTGGKILGRHIDLGYDEDDIVLWYRWTDVYLLAPPPPRSEINWILPNWPRPPH